MPPGTITSPRDIAKVRRRAGIEGFREAFFIVGLVTSDEFVVYLLLLFVYSVATTVALPLPVEPLLLLYPEITPIVKAMVLGLGKGVGAIAVFLIGHKVNAWLERWMTRWPLGSKILRALEKFVRKTGVIGLGILLSIPFMSDTAVNYFYSVLNEEGRAISRTQFVLANIVGGGIRTLVFLALVPG